MVEVYNEEYKDLLGKGAPAGKKHQVFITKCGFFVSIHIVPLYVCAAEKLPEHILLYFQVSHDDKGNTSVSYLEAVDVSQPERVQVLLDKAMKQVTPRCSRHFNLKLLICSPS